MRIPAVAAVLCVLLSACFPVGQRIEEGPAQPVGPGVVGPTLALLVFNRSPEMVEVGYEFTSPNSSGGGSGSVGPCERLTTPFGQVLGSFQVVVDGTVVDEDTVPAGIAADAYLVIQVDIGADGVPEVGGRLVVATLPPPIPMVMPGCG